MRKPFTRGKTIKREENKMKKTILCIIGGLLIGFFCAGEQPAQMGTNLVDPWYESYQTMPELRNSTSYDENRLRSHPTDLERRKDALTEELARLNNIAARAAHGSLDPRGAMPSDQSTKQVAAATATDTATVTDMIYFEYFDNSLPREKCISYTSERGWE